MTPGARLRAGAEILDDIFQRHRPASVALADWGRANRFAGSGDRSAIGTLVFEALRRKRSIAAAMDSDSSRALVLGAASAALGLDAEGVAKVVDGSRFALEPLEAAELEALKMQAAGELREGELPAAVRGDYPDWVAPMMERAFGDDAAAHGAALAQRAPIDLRVNALKATPDKVLNALKKFGAEPGPLSSLAVRIPPPPPGRRAPNVEADAAHGKGWFEVQDAGSQVAALLAGAGPRQQVLDLCAGAGGKTLALAAQMQNTGQIFAYDRDAVQLRPIFERLKRAGVRNAQVMSAGDTQALEAMAGKFDVVFVDAPCTGSGTWRRRPDAKWRLKPEALATRQEEQKQVLESAAPLVRPGGRLVYVTCSIFPEENSDQIRWFLERQPDYSFQKVPQLLDESGDILTYNLQDFESAADGLMLTPLKHSTDGFFIAACQKAA